MVPQFFQCPGLLVICPFFHVMDCSRGPLANPQMYHLQQSTGQNFFKHPESLDRSARDQPFWFKENLEEFTLQLLTISVCTVYAFSLVDSALSSALVARCSALVARSVARCSALTARYSALSTKEKAYTIHTEVVRSCKILTVFLKQSYLWFYIISTNKP